MTITTSMLRRVVAPMVLASAALASGCAANVSEVRSARVLRGGEMQVSEVNNVVVPTRALADLYSQGKTIAKRADQGALPAAEKQELAVAATAIALTGPGYGVHLDFGIGLGYRFDAQARIGNGIYALSLRRGFDLGLWDLSLGGRAAYNTGGSVVPYIDSINSLAKVSSMRRFDGQLFVMLGRHYGEWGKIWLGTKAMWSPYELTLDTTKVGGTRETLRDRLDHYGGFAGLALGFRWIHFVAELTVLRSRGDVVVLGATRDLGGWVVAPSWGFQGTF